MPLISTMSQFASIFRFIPPLGNTTCSFTWVNNKLLRIVVNEIDPMLKSIVGALTKIGESKIEFVNNDASNLLLAVDDIGNTFPYIVKNHVDIHINIGSAGNGN